MIFERLYQDPNSVDDSRKGLGLGLNISKELVRLHGGQISVESQLPTAALSSSPYRCFRWRNFSLRSLLIMDDCASRSLLITVEIAPSNIPFTGSWDEIRLHCLQLLEPCILGDKDAILPAMGRTGLGESL